MSLYSIKFFEIRKFGLVSFIFFGCLFLLGVWMKKPIPTYLFGSLTFLGLGFITFPVFLKPIYTVWMKFAHFIGRVITLMILIWAYYFVITPSALIKRVFGGVPLTLKVDKSALSYWVTRSESVQPKERFIKRY